MEALHNKIAAYTKENPYDCDNEIILHRYPRRIISLLGEVSSRSLLELGLGHGYSAFEFSRYIKDYTILEGDSKIIENFNISHDLNSIDIINAFFEDYVPDRHFDVIVAGFILEHVDDPLLILKKYREYLSERGKFYIAVPNAEALNRRVGHAAGFLPDIQQLSEADRDLGHKRYFTLASIRTLCDKAGLRITHEEGLYLKPLTTKQMISLNLDASIMDAFCTVGRDYPELSLGILLECERFS